jgi:uncharacterized protein
MKNSRLVLPIAVAFVIIASGFFFFVAKNIIEPSGPADSTITITVGEKIIIAEVVDTPDKMTRGLGGRENLSDGEGVWFIFAESAKHGIWMRNMKFPIDILWFDENLRLVHVKEDANPDTYPEIFSPPVNSRFVLEIPSGYAEKTGIKLGDTVQIQP